MLYNYNIWIIIFICLLYWFSSYRSSHSPSNSAFFIIALNFSFLFYLRNHHLCHRNTDLVQATKIEPLAWCWSCNCLESQGTLASGRCRAPGSGCGWCQLWTGAVEWLVQLAAIAFVVGFDNYFASICYLSTCPCRSVRSLRGLRWSQFVGVWVEVLEKAWVWV